MWDALQVSPETCALIFKKASSVDWQKKHYGTVPIIEIG